MNIKKYKSEFKKNGYIIVNIVDKKKLNILKESFAGMVEILIKKKFNFKTHFKNKNAKINYLLSQGMLKLDKKNHKYISNLYDQVVKSVDFYNLITEKKIISLVNGLLDRKRNLNLYVNSTSIRMDTPGLTPFVYGWHQDSKSNIKNSNFVQMWMPVFNNVGKELGGLHILEKSFKHKILTTHTKVEKEKLKKKEILRAAPNVKILSKGLNLKEKVLYANVGEAIFFNKNLMHKSGINKTKNKLRYVCTSFYHDIYNPNWKFEKLDHK